MEKHVVAAYKVHRIICKDKCIHINGHKIAIVCKDHGISQRSTKIIEFCNTFCKDNRVKPFD